jgi:hypothetical protein
MLPSTHFVKLHRDGVVRCEVLVVVVMFFLGWEVVVCVCGISVSLLGLGGHLRSFSIVGVDNIFIWSTTIISPLNFPTVSNIVTMYKRVFILYVVSAAIVLLSLLTSFSSVTNIEFNNNLSVDGKWIHKNRIPMTTLKSSSIIMGGTIALSKNRHRRTLILGPKL